MQKIHDLKPGYNSKKKRKMLLNLSINSHMKKCQKHIKNMINLKKRLE